MNLNHLTVNCSCYKIVTLIVTILEFLPLEVISQALPCTSCQDFAVVLLVCMQLLNSVQHEQEGTRNMLAYKKNPVRISVSVPISTRLMELILFPVPTTAKSQ